MPVNPAAIDRERSRLLRDLTAGADLARRCIIKVPVAQLADHKCLPLSGFLCARIRTLNNLAKHHLRAISRHLGGPRTAMTPDGQPPLSPAHCPIFENVGDRVATLATSAETFHRAIPNSLVWLKGSNFP